MFKIWPTNRFSNAKSYNFHFQENYVTWPLSANGLFLVVNNIIMFQDLHGVYSARAFVEWYNGLPANSQVQWWLSCHIIFLMSHNFEWFFFVVYFICFVCHSSILSRTIYGILVTWQILCHSRPRGSGCCCCKIFKEGLERNVGHLLLPNQFQLHFKKFLTSDWLRKKVLANRKHGN